MELFSLYNRINWTRQWDNISLVSTISSEMECLGPDFVEIEENIEYLEKEDEFDIIDEDELHKKRLEEEDYVADVLKMDTTDARGFDITQDSFIIPINYEKNFYE